MASSRSLESRVAIVTGGSRGIGAAVSANLASKGCSLILNYTSASSAEKTSALASHLSKTYSIGAVPVQADIGSPSAAEAIMSAAKQHFSSESLTISIIVNNAGVARNVALGGIDPTEFHRQYSVNVLGPLLLVQACLPYLPHDRSGRIVNVSSVSSSLGYKQQSIYGGTKAALEAMTRTWSRELAERATVNSINPGPVATDMYENNDEEFLTINSSFIKNTPLAQVSVERDGRELYDKEAPKGGRAATPEEIAGIVGMLCSTESGWCTGSVICANGGMRFSQ